MRHPLPLRSLPARLAANRRGATAVIVGLSTPVMLGGVGFGTDSALIRIANNELQVAADAAALAGARALPGGQQVTQATALARENMPVAKFGDVLKPVDVVTGTWSTESRSFAAGGGTPNAVRVTTRLASANGNAHQLIFGKWVGLDSVELSASATAIGDTVTSTQTTTKDCVTKTDLSLVYNGLPTRTSIVTLGEGSPTTYFESKDHYPIVRIDSGYDGQATVSFDAAGKGTYTFIAPARGQYAVEVRMASIRNNTPAVPMTVVFNKVKSVPPAPGGASGGTSTWTNSLRTLTQLPGTPLCTDGTVAVATVTSTKRKGRLTS